MRSLDRPSSGGGEKKPGDAGKGKRREPRINVKMASLPEVVEPSPGKPVAGEPKAQKPDVKLSPDVIAGHRQGMRAPLEQLVKEDTEKKRAGTTAKRGGLSGFTGEKRLVKAIRISRTTVLARNWQAWRALVSNERAGKGRARISRRFQRLARRRLRGRGCLGDRPRNAKGSTPRRLEKRR